MGEGVTGLLQRPRDEGPVGRNQGCSALRAKQAHSLVALALGAEAGVDPALAIEISACDKAGDADVPAAARQWDCPNMTPGLARTARPGSQP